MGYFFTAARDCTAWAWRAACCFTDAARSGLPPLRAAVTPAAHHASLTAPMNALHVRLVVWVARHAEVGLGASPSAAAVCRAWPKHA